MFLFFSKEREKKMMGGGIFIENNLTLFIHFI
jgi:hypothetical protein